jgi:hypothetical protein
VKKRHFLNLPRLIALLALFLVFLVGARSSEVMAQPRANPVSPPTAYRSEGGKVSVRLLVVAATDSHKGIDPRLQSLAKHLNFLRYQGYDLLNSYNASLGSDSDVTFTIEGGRRVTVNLLKKTPDKAQFRVQMFNQGGKLLDTTLSVNRNGTFIVAGPRYNDGILILPLQVSY